MSYPPWQRLGVGEDTVKSRDPPNATGVYLNLSPGELSCSSHVDRSKQFHVTCVAML